MTEQKKFKNPFVEAAKKASGTPNIPNAKTAQVQKAKFTAPTLSSKPLRKTSGRGR